MFSIPPDYPQFSRARGGHKMADYEVKTLRRFASKAPSAPPSIQTVPVYKRQNIVLLSNGNEFLYLIVESSIVVSIYIYLSGHSYI